MWQPVLVYKIKEIVNKDFMNELENIFFRNWLWEVRLYDSTTWDTSPCRTLVGFTSGFRVVITFVILVYLTFACVLYLDRPLYYTISLDVLSKPYKLLFG